jgi:hypothetical protein
MECGFEGCAREPVPWSFRCQPCGAACPSAYPRPHWNIKMAGALGQQAEKRMTASGVQYEAPWHGVGSDMCSSIV